MNPAGPPQAEPLARAGRSGPGETLWPRPPATELRALYRSYRRRQARRLVEMLPRDRIRPLYRAALARRTSSDGPVDDPLEALVSHCATLLPLPPFRVWLEDLARHPEEHLRDLADSHEAPTASRPATLAERVFPAGGRTRLARLRAFQAEGVWRGWISFPSERCAESRAPRTAVIFREPDPEALRSRFLEFEDRSLEAFLRSAGG